MSEGRKLHHVFMYRAKHDIDLPTVTGKCYKFVAGELYSAFVFSATLDLAEIAIEDTRVKINLSWLLENFDPTGTPWTLEVEKKWRNKGE